MQTETEKIHYVTGQYVELISKTLTSKTGGIVPEIAISYCATLSGSLLLRSFNLNLDALKAGDVVLSNEANEQGPLLVNTLFSELQRYGLSLDEHKLSEYSSNPVISIDTKQITQTLQQDAINISNHSELEYKGAAIAAAQATAFIVKECAQSLELEKACSIAILGFVTGTKTVPAQLVNHQSKPWYKFW